MIRRMKTCEFGKKWYIQRFEEVHGCIVSKDCEYCIFPDGKRFTISEVIAKEDNNNYEDAERTL